MKDKTYLAVILAMLAMVITGCGDEPGPYMGCVLPSYYDRYGEAWRDSVYKDSQLRQRHRESRLKILALGNSFTNNATTYLPRLLGLIDEDSICIAKLTRSGCSLQMHWTSHVEDSSDYELYYSDLRRWVKEDIYTIDEALTIMDWDIITIQQDSGHSGIYTSYWPYLDYLVKLFYETNPNVKIAWHSTWAYRTGCEHTHFNLYDNDPQKMHDAILSVAAQVSASMDFRIPSTELIWRMRQEYPEVDDGFSSDGFHITDPRALYALSLLWYEVLVSPYSGKSSLENSIFPKEVDPDFMSRAISIVADLTGIH